MLKRNFLLILSCTIIASCFSVNAYGDSVDDMHNSAYQSMKNGEYVKAIETYTTILEIEEYDETALLNRAVAFATIGNDKSALNDFSLVLDKDPENLIALNGKATILSNFECTSFRPSQNHSPQYHPKSCRGQNKENPQGKEFRGVESYLTGSVGSPSLVKI